MRIFNANKIKYLMFLFLFSCAEERKINKKQTEGVAFVITEKLIIKKPNYYEFFLKSKDTVYEVSSARFVMFNVADTLFLEKSKRHLFLKSYSKIGDVRDKTRDARSQ